MDSSTPSDIRSGAVPGTQFDPCLCKRAGESGEDCPWHCGRAREEALLDRLLRSYRAKPDPQVADKQPGLMCGEP